MKTADQVSPEKLRGGFYSPDALVRFCLRRLGEIAPEAENLRLLEPSVGDGAFIRGLASSELRMKVGEVVGIEKSIPEAQKARDALQGSGIAGTVISGSSLTWFSEASQRPVDLAVGNPPFVRFQFLDDSDRSAIKAVEADLGISFRGVSNIWIPILLGTLDHLRANGGFCFILPTECLTGLSAEIVRDWLISHTKDLTLDFFEPGSFPDVLQEVAVLSGRRRSKVNDSGSMVVRFREHVGERNVSAWKHNVSSGQRWTRYLLTPLQLEALVEVEHLSGFSALDSVATMEVSIVTGANSFFTVDRETVRRFALDRWAKPLLPRIKHSPGLIFTHSDHSKLVAEGQRGWLLDFSGDSPDPSHFEGASEYLSLGFSEGFARRYKCRIRSPWYRVPSIRSGELLLSKRSHRCPKLVLNRAGALTTDTIYRGYVKKHDSGVTASSLVSSFHNSATLLTAEVEGRSFGGGVLELVPSEVARLLVPVSNRLNDALPSLDNATRQGDFEDLIRTTNSLLLSSKVLSPQLLSRVEDARTNLMLRRLSRNQAAQVRLETLPEAA